MVEKKEFLTRFCIIIVFKFFFSFSDMFSDMSAGRFFSFAMHICEKWFLERGPFFTFHWTHTSGLELQGRPSPLKYLTQPISNLFLGYHRQSTANAYDEEINSNLTLLESNFTQSVCDLCRVEKMDSAKISFESIMSNAKGTETAAYDMTAKAKAEAAGRDQQLKIEQTILQVKSNWSKISDSDKNHMKLNIAGLEKKLTELKFEIGKLTKQSLERGTCSCKDYLDVEKEKKNVDC